jgi:hypothetical protein
MRPYFENTHPKKWLVEWLKGKPRVQTPVLQNKEGLISLFKPNL